MQTETQRQTERGKLIIENSRFRLIKLEDETTPRWFLFTFCPLKSDILSQNTAAFCLTNMLLKLKLQLKKKTKLFHRVWCSRQFLRSSIWHYYLRLTGVPWVVSLIWIAVIRFSAFILPSIPYDGKRSMRDRILYNTTEEVGWKMLAKSMNLSGVCLPAVCH